MRSTIDRADIHVVVPATEPEDQPASPKGSGAEIARRRLEAALDRFAAAGVPATGEVGDADPLQAARHAVAQGNYTGLIVSTLPAGISRWLHLDPPPKAEGGVGLPGEGGVGRTAAAA